MKFIKHAFICGLILALLFLASCTRVGDNQKRVYDDEEMIAAEGDSYTYSKRLGSVRISQLSIDFSGFSGKETVWEVTAQEETSCSLDVSADITKGKFKLCLVSETGAVTTIFENDQAGVLSVSLPPGANRLILVGYGADGRVNVMIQPDSDNRAIDVKVIRF